MASEISEFQLKIERFVTDGDIENAFEFLNEYNKDETIRNSLILLQSRYKKNKFEEIEGVLGHNDYRVEIQKVEKALLSLSLEIEKKHPVDGSSIYLNDLPEYVDVSFSIFEIKDISFLPSEKKAKKGLTIKLIERPVTAFIKNLTLKREDDLSILSKIQREARIIFVMGYPGQGKTALCGKLFESFLEAPKILNPYYFHLGKIHDVNEFKKYPLTYVRDLIEKGGRHKMKVLEPAVLILDGLHDIPWMDYDEIKVFSKTLSTQLHSYFPDYYVIITTRFHLIDFSDFIVNHSILLALEPWNSEQRSEWLKNRGIDADGFDKIWANNQPFQALEILPGVIEQSLNSNGGDFSNEEIFRFFLERSWKKHPYLIPSSQTSVETYFLFWGYLALVSGIKEQGGSKLLKSDIFDKSFGDLFFKFRTKFENGNSEYFVFDDEMTIRRFLSDGLFPVLKTENLDEIPIVFQDERMREFFWAKFIFEIIKNHFPISSEKAKDEVARNSFEILWRCFVDPGISEATLQYLLSFIGGNSIHKDRKKSLKEAFSIVVRDQLLFRYQAFNDAPPPIDKCLSGFYSFWKFFKAVFPSENLISPEIRDEFIKLLRLFRATDQREIDLSRQIFIEGQFQDMILKPVKLNKGEFIDANFRNSTFSLSCAIGTKFYRSDFSFADLEDAEMQLSKFNEAILDEAKLVGAKLQRANFSNAHLVSADLSKAHVESCVFDNANLNGAIFSDAFLDSKTSFKNADLRKATLDRIFSIPLDDLAGKLLDAKTLFMCSLHPHVEKTIRDKADWLFLDPDNENF
ncbi:MAG: pentapeptide repeat-containing protein [Haliscomenobacter sp.]|nr:pentapeptide repeat-containing protein [Haliscomenobacter sp.]